MNSAIGCGGLFQLPKENTVAESKSSLSFVFPKLMYVEILIASGNHCHRVLPHGDGVCHGNI